MSDVVVSLIGALMVEAETKAKTKANGYLAKATDCTCEVEVVWFSESSRRYRISRCAEHPVRKGPQ